jgi:vesicle-fusing ATPase
MSRPAGAHALERERPLVLAEIDRARTLVQAYADGAPPPVAARPRRSSFERIAALFGLSSFERDVLTLAAAVELDGELGRLVATLQGGTDPRPGFGLALAALPDGHWDALAPHRPLRRWRLVDLGPGATLATRAVCVDEHVLHWLVGLVEDDADDSALAGLIRDVPPTPLTLTHEVLTDQLLRAVDGVHGATLVRLDGSDRSAQLAIAQRLASELGLRALVLRDDAAIDGADIPRVARLVDRAARLRGVLPVVCSDRIGDHLEAPLVVALGEGTQYAGRTTLRRSVELPEPGEQRAIWHAALGADDDLDAAIEELAAHYRLSGEAVHAIAAEYAGVRNAAADPAASLRRITRERARVGLDGLAERLDLRATWDDLVLPEGQLAVLRDLASQVRHRTTVYERWGFGDRANRGLGVTALFTGESGTGKTMAAEVLAEDLGLDLYRIDLSAVVSKYIGETEKNLRAVFEAAEGSGAVLLFDEADALFGKRGEVRDAHDRYANLEIAYLLQRMECYRGLAVLTTNLRSNVDRAFLRRLRFVVQFPFPDDALRTELWRRAFPTGAPTQRLDPAVLARLQVSGGSIRSIALGAAFAAAQDGTPIRPQHVLHAARVEYAKADKALTSAETSGLEAAR